MELPLLQIWLPSSEQGSYPEIHNFLWKEGLLTLKAEFIDQEMITTATAHGHRRWEYGDVVELFIQNEE